MRQLTGAQVMQQLLTAQSDPKLVAVAYRDYFGRMTERLGKINAGIIQLLDFSDDIHQIPTSIDPSISRNLLSLYVSNSNNITTAALITAEDLYAQMREQVISNGSIDPDFELELIAKAYDETAVTVKMTVDEVCTQLGDSLDSVSITYESLRALCVDDINAGVTFMNDIMNTATQGSLIIKNISKDMNLILQSKVPFKDKLAMILDFSSIRQLTQDPEEYVENQSAISDYTGTNPFLSWLGGIDVDFSSFWSGLKTAGAWYLSIAKFMIWDMTIAIGKGIWKGMTWVWNKGKELFSDPVDYTCTGETIEYFNPTQKFNVECRYTTTENQSPALLQWATKKIKGSSNIGEQMMAIQLGHTFTKMSVSLDDSSGCTINVENSYKPVNYNQIVGISRATYGSQVPSTGVANLGQIMDIMAQLANADLTFPKNTDERAISIGLRLAKWLDNIYGYLLTRLTCFCTAQELEDFMNSTIDVDSYGISYSSGDVQNTGVQNALRMFNRALCAWLNQCWKYATEALPTSDTSVIIGLNGTSVAPNTIMQYFYVPVTNTQLIADIQTYYSSEAIESDPDGNTSGSIAVAYNNNIVTDVDKYSTNGIWRLLVEPVSYQVNLDEGLDFASNVDERMVGFHTSAIAAAAFQARLEHLNKVHGKEVDGVYMGYTRDNSYTVEYNCAVCSDKDNVAKFQNFLKKAGITLLAVAAVAAVGVGIGSLVTAARKSALTTTNLGMKYANLVNSGSASPEDLKTAYEAYNGSRIKSSILSKLTGTVNSTANQIVDVGFQFPGSEIGSSFIQSQTDQVLRVIKD